MVFFLFFFFLADDNAVMIPLVAIVNLNGSIKPFPVIPDGHIDKYNVGHSWCYRTNWAQHGSITLITGGFKGHS